MSYDYQKVQAWLARVPLPAGTSLFLACVGVAAALPPEVESLVAEFKAASRWEQVNMLFGLRDGAVQQQLACLVHDWSQQARREDEAATSITFSVVAEDDPRYVPRMTLLAPVTPDVCSVCHQSFMHHQHPMKPLGVIISSTCGCNPTTEQADGQGH